MVEEEKQNNYFSNEEERSKYIKDMYLWFSLLNPKLNGEETREELWKIVDETRLEFEKIKESEN